MSERPRRSLTAKRRQPDRPDVESTAARGEFPSAGLIFEYEDYKGPVPHPRLIQGYQDAIPNGGERVMAMAEAEAEHRRGMENRQLQDSFRAHVLGQVCGFILAVVVVGLGAWLISKGHSLAGYATLIVGAASLVRSVFRRSA
jgi:uncharacterized membrane protein